MPWETHVGRYLYSLLTPSAFNVLKSKLEMQRIRRGEFYPYSVTIYKGILYFYHEIIKIKNYDLLGNILVPDIESVLNITKIYET